MRFIEILPDLTAPACTSVNAELVAVHTLAHVSIIQLHHPFAQKNPASHSKCLRAAETVVHMIRRIPDIEFQFLDPIIGVRIWSLFFSLLRVFFTSKTALTAVCCPQTCWMCASDVFIRERAWGKQQPPHAASALFDVEEKLSTLIEALNRLSFTFPVASE